MTHGRGVYVRGYRGASRGVRGDPVGYPWAAHWLSMEHSWVAPESSVKCPWVARGSAIGRRRNSHQMSHKVCLRAQTSTNAKSSEDKPGWARGGGWGQGQELRLGRELRLRQGLGLALD